MWKILQQNKADDFVVSTGKTYTVRKFVEVAGQILGFKIIWRKKGLNEIGIDKNTNRTIIKINKKYLRPTDVNYLRGDFSKIKRKIGWKPKISFYKLVEEMVNEDFKKKLNKNEKRILITGSSGMLGKDLVKKIKYKVFTPNRNKLNLFNYNKIKKYLKKIK